MMRVVALALGVLGGVIGLSAAFADPSARDLLSGASASPVNGAVLGALGMVGGVLAIRRPVAAAGVMAVAGLGLLVRRRRGARGAAVLLVGARAGLPGAEGAVDRRILSDRHLRMVAQAMNIQAALTTRCQHAADRRQDRACQRFGVRVPTSLSAGRSAAADHRGAALRIPHSSISELSVPVSVVHRPLMGRSCGPAATATALPSLR